MEQKIGSGIIRKSPMGLVILTFIAAGLFAYSADFWPVGLQGVGFGGLSALMLLGYWHGKGGVWFILSLLMPLVHIVFAQIPSVVALVFAVVGFFFGFALLLAGTALLQKGKN
ncbi:hypothetical protein [Pseudoalteromonas xiamenensis]